MSKPESRSPELVDAMRLITQTGKRPKIQYPSMGWAIERYQNETRRLYGVLNTQLSKKEFLAGDYSIADIANWSWVRVHNFASVSLDEFAGLKRWYEQLEARPALARGAAIPHQTNFNEPEKEIGAIESTKNMISK